MSRTSAALTAYRTRQAAGNLYGEAAEPAAVEAGLAQLALDEMGDLGLKDAYPRYDGALPRAFAGDPPFWFTRPFNMAAGRFEQVSVGGDAALGPVPGGQMVLHLPLECCIALGVSRGDAGQLTVARDTWLLHMALFLNLNRTLNGLVPNGIGLEKSVFLAGDIQWGPEIWYCLRWPLDLYLNYVTPTGG